MKRFGLLVVVALLLGAGATSSASTGGLALGTYEEITTCTDGCLGGPGTFTNYFSIDAYNSTTGEISGSVLGGAGVMTGTFDGSTITMRWAILDGSGYVAQLVAAVDGAGAMAGTATDNRGQHTTWIGTPDVPCSVVTSAAHDLIVTAGTRCSIAGGAAIGHDVVVQPGGSLIDTSATIPNDVRADHPAGIGIGTNGSVGHDIVIDGATGAIGSDNYICNTHVGHDVIVENTAATAGFWDIGDAPECTRGGVTVGNDMVLRDNAVLVDASLNGTHPLGDQAGGIGHDLIATGNASQTVAGNVVGNNATCRPILVPSIPNQVGGVDDGCDGLPVPLLAAPVDGASYTSTSVPVSGTAEQSATVLVFDGGVLVASFAADATGAFNAIMSLPYGAHAITAEQSLGGLTSAATAVHAITNAPAAPLVTSPADGAAFSSGAVPVAGTAEPSASVSIFDGGSFVRTVAADASGTFSTVVNLAFGPHTLTATQTVNGVESAPSAPRSIVLTPASPTLTSPADGASFRTHDIPVAGNAEPGAAVSVFDGGVYAGTLAVDATGAFSGTVALADGGHSITATQAVGTVVSAPTAARSILVDTLPPLVSCGSADGTWHNTNVTIACTAVDTGSGLANAADGSFGLSTHVAAGTADANAATDSRNVCDAVGNCRTAGPVVGNEIDRANPVLRLPANITTSNVVVSYVATATDDDDPSPTVSCTPPSGSTFTAGTTTVNCTATDHAGNTSTGSFTVTVAGPLQRLTDAVNAIGNANLKAHVRNLSRVGGNGYCSQLKVIASELAAIKPQTATTADALDAVASLQRTAGCSR